MKKKSCWTIFTILSVIVVISCGPRPAPEQTHLAIANGNTLKIVDPESQETLEEITRYQEVHWLAYHPKGKRLAVTVCFGNRIVELKTDNYGESRVLLEADSCPWDLGYSPDGLSFAATIPKRNETGWMTGYLKVVGENELDRELAKPLRAVSYRPGGKEIAVAGPQGLKVFKTDENYPLHAEVPEIRATSLGYTIDGSRLIAGTSAGYALLDAAANYTIEKVTADGEVKRVAVDPTGGWIALMRQTSVSLHRVPDFEEVKTLQAQDAFRDVAFSRDGSRLAIAERSNRVRIFKVFSWDESNPISVSGRVDAVAFKPRETERIPVLFVHGCCGNSGKAWFEKGIGLNSFAAVMAANPQLPIDAFYLELPLHGSGYSQNRDIGIEEHAQDILAAIEGGLDSRGRDQVGILNMPAYRSVNRVAVIAYSLGTVSSRYYVKYLMGSRSSGMITISEFVTLAAPYHGAASILACYQGQADRATRQVCDGYTSSAWSVLRECGKCERLPSVKPDLFNNNMPGDEGFITRLNGHPLSDSCDSTQDHPGEAPKSRPTTPGGILYVNLYAANNADIIVGGGTQSKDCMGRRLAKNLAPDAVNREISGVPAEVHSNFPHYWDTICLALKTVVNHEAPTPAEVCCDLKRN